MLIHIKKTRIAFELIHQIQQNYNVNNVKLAGGVFDILKCHAKQNITLRAFLQI